MEKFDIGLQASGAAIHLRLGRALLHTANVLGGCRRQKCDNKNERAAGSPDPPMRMRHVGSLMNFGRRQCFRVLSTAQGSL
jgi:hypothetical protein